jgi:anti-anti-sigma factor
VAAPLTDLVARTVTSGAAVGSYLREGAVLICAVGEFDVATAPVLEQAIARARSAALDVQLDLSGVTFLDAASLGVLVEARCTLAKDGRTFSIVSPARNVSRLLKITELEGLLRPATLR